MERKKYVPATNFRWNKFKKTNAKRCYKDMIFFTLLPIEDNIFKEKLKWVIENVVFWKINQKIFF